MAKDGATPSFDVLMIGAGITGRAALMHLARRGLKSVALADAGTGGCATAVAAGLISGGQVDNFTRVSHAHGADFGAALWRFGDRAYDALLAFAKEHAIPLRERRRLRLITSEPELIEARRAVREAAQAGIAGVSLAEGGGAFGGALTSRTLAVQDDGPRGGWVDPDALMAKLAALTPAARFGAVTALVPSPQGITATFAGGGEARAELVIVAAHLGIRGLIPELHEALVSVADQWSEVTLASAPGGVDLTGVHFTANHTYEWGVYTAPDRLRLGGGRYLRPLAGIEAEVAVADPKIAAHLQGQLAKTFQLGAAPVLGVPHAGLDIRPCDELPIIGPMYGDGRILVAAGFMGAGLTQGFFAGQCLAELVQTGRCDALPRRLWPERLRSLES